MSMWDDLDMDRAAVRKWIHEGCEERFFVEPQEDHVTLTDGCMVLQLPPAVALDALRGQGHLLTRAKAGERGAMFFGKPHPRVVAVDALLPDMVDTVRAYATGIFVRVADDHGEDRLGDYFLGWGQVIAVESAPASCEVINHRFLECIATEDEPELFAVVWPESPRRAIVWRKGPVALYAQPYVQDETELGQVCLAVAHVRLGQEAVKKMGASYFHAGVRDRGRRFK